MFGLSKPQQDRIIFDRIPLNIIIGGDEEELRHKQTILVSLNVGVPRRIMRRAARTDLLTNAVDFKPLVEMVHAVGEESTSEKRKDGGRTYTLLETLAADIAKAAFEGFPIKDIRVAIQKPQRYGTVGGIGVDMQWTRPNVVQRKLDALGLKMAPLKAAMQRFGRQRQDGLSTHV